MAWGGWGGGRGGVGALFGMTVPAVPKEGLYRGIHPPINLLIVFVFVLHNGGMGTFFCY